MCIRDSACCACAGSQLVQIGSELTSVIWGLASKTSLAPANSCVETRAPGAAEEHDVSAGVAQLVHDPLRLGLPDERGDLVGVVEVVRAGGALRVGREVHHDRPGLGGLADRGQVRLAGTGVGDDEDDVCLLYTSPSPRDS